MIILHTPDEVRKLRPALLKQTERVFGEFYEITPEGWAILRDLPGWLTGNNAPQRYYLQGMTTVCWNATLDYYPDSVGNNQEYQVVFFLNTDIMFKVVFDENKIYPYGRGSRGDSFHWTGETFECVFEGDYASDDTITVICPAIEHYNAEAGLIKVRGHI